MHNFKYFWLNFTEYSFCIIQGAIKVIVIIFQIVLCNLAPFPFTLKIPHSLIELFLS